VLVFFQVGAPALLVVVAAIEWIVGGLPSQAIDPKLSWLSPFSDDYSDLLSGMLLAVFIYWGWESALNLSEETEDSDTAPGVAGLASTVILLATYMLVGIAVIAVAGTKEVKGFGDNPGILGSIAHDVLGPFAFLVTLRDHRLRTRVCADDDHPQLPDVPLDGPRRRPAEGVRQGPSPVSDP
jgi:amino acid transporter